MSDRMPAHCTVGIRHGKKGLGRHLPVQPFLQRNSSWR